MQHFLPLHGDHVYPSAAPKAITRGNAPCARLAGIFGIGSIARDHHHGGSVIFLVEQVPDKHAEVQSSAADVRSEEHTSELQSLMRISYAVFCLTKKKTV